jgi:uncharacterized protein (DUF433 family)
MVGKTRVPLETVIWTYKEGSSPEEIVESYDALSLGDVALLNQTLSARLTISTDSIDFM